MSRHAQIPNSIALGPLERFSLVRTKKKRLICRRQGNPIVWPSVCHPASKTSATAGNRTRVETLGGFHHATRPRLPPALVTGWPSGLRRQTQVLFSSEARVRTPLLSRIVWYGTSSSRPNPEPLAKVINALPPGFEPGLLDSRSRVLTTTLQEHQQQQQRCSADPACCNCRRGIAALGTAEKHDAFVRCSLCPGSRPAGQKNLPLRLY